MIKQITDEDMQGLAYGIMSNENQYQKMTDKIPDYQKHNTLPGTGENMPKPQATLHQPPPLHQTPPHYQGLQPYDVMDAWYGEANLTAKEGHLIGDIIKRIARLNRKGQRGEDLDKIIHQTQLLKELWEEKEKAGI